jgi:hypothetical protein
MYATRGNPTTSVPEVKSPCQGLVEIPLDQFGSTGRTTSKSTKVLVNSSTFSMFIIIMI